MTLTLKFRNPLWCVALLGILLSGCGGGSLSEESTAVQPVAKQVASTENAESATGVAASILQKDFGNPQSPETVSAMAEKLGAYFGRVGALLPEGRSAETKALALPKVAPYPQPVYRFFNTRTGVHFYTISLAERNQVLINFPWFNLEGPGFYAQPSPVAGLSPIYRFYNRITGTHFYTINEVEKNTVIANFSDTYQLDGPAMWASTGAASGWVPMHRFYNGNTGTHFYTANESERQNVVATMPGMHYDGIGYYVQQSSDEPVGIDPVDKYVGTWRQCTNYGSGSELSTVTISKTYTSAGAFSGTDASFNALNCSGVRVTDEPFSGTFTFVGTKAIGGKLVDKMVMDFHPGSLKQVFFIASNTLQYFGLSPEDGATFDGEGFPNELEPIGYTKQ